MRTIPEYVRQHAQRSPQSSFCSFLSGGVAQDISFAELYRAGRAYACELQELGVVPGDVVVIILRHSPHLFSSFLGAMLAGAIPSFIPFPSNKQRTDAYWEDNAALFARIEPKLIVTYEQNRSAMKAALPDLAIGVLIADDAIAERVIPEVENFPDLIAQVENVACLQHSSGTTGLKKGVMLSHRAIVSEVESYAAAIGFSNADSIVSWLPLYHDMGFIACFMTSLVRGTKLIALDPFEWVMRPQMLLEAIERYRPTFCWLPNFAFSHIVKTAQKGAFDLSSIRVFINCSEPCKLATFQRFAERFAGNGVDIARLQVCYAMAENVFAVTQTELGQPVRSIAVDPVALSLGTIVPTSGEPAVSVMSCGRAIPGVELRIRTETGEPVADDAIGEIHVASAFLFDGYYRQPDVTAKRLRDGWYATGDLGFLRDGELYVTGRVDDMLIVNGRNFYAHEIEALVSTVSGTIPGRNVAIAIDDERSDATVVVVLAESNDPEAEVANLSRQVREAINDHLGLAINSVRILPPGSLVKTTSGKISRFKNKELFLDPLPPPSVR